jgi:hypothetical protein
LALVALLGSQLVSAARSDLAVAHKLRAGAEAEAEAAAYGTIQEAIYSIATSRNRSWAL